MKPIKIIVVEDEEIVKLLITEILENAGYKIIADTSTGEEALELTGKYSPDLILMDINLKGEMDGIETASQINNRYGTPIIYITAYSDDLTLKRAKITNPYGYVVKPFDGRALVSVIEMSQGRIAAEKALKQSEEKYRTIFEESLDFIYMRTIDGKFIDINPAGVKMLGYISKEEIFKLEIGADIYYNQEDKLIFEKKIAESGFVKEMEMQLKRKDGKKLYVLVSSSALTNNKGNITGYMGVIRDITERVLTEKQMLQISNQLLQANEKIKSTQAAMIQHEKLASIGQLAAGVAHELNNPIGFISSNAMTLEKYFNLISNYVILLESIAEKIKHTPCQFSDELDKINTFKKEKKLDFIFEDIPDIFAESREGYTRITSIVENLRSFSRVDYSDKISEHDINKAIENTLVVAQNEIKYAAKVVKKFSDIPLIECHGNEINQVLLNVIVNASQAIKSLNKKEKGTIEIQTYESEGNIYCKISDNGPGIPQKIIDKIFDPFFTTKEVGKGTGLGLNISYDIVVNKHKGQLLVESQEGSGTCFTIILPVHSPLKRNEIDE